MTTSIVAFVAVLGLLIFFHELGHFLLARFFGVGVETFSLGYGTRLLGKTIGRTDYRISMVPIGGYCKMVGEEPGTEIDPEDVAVSFTHQHVMKRICIVVAGPIFNILLAVILLFGLFQVTGLLIYTPSVGSVVEGSPAEAGGLEA
ncbi:MAG: site-2 protease family protein, partial [Desulfobacterales bacterium]